MDLSEIKVTTKKEKQFNAKGIYTVEDLLRFMPVKYYDFSFPTSLDDYVEGDICSVVGELQSAKVGRGCVYATVRDDISYRLLHVIWFVANADYLIDKLNEMFNIKVIVCGEIGYNEVFNQIQIKSPIIFSEDVQRYQGIYPVYQKITGMSSEYLLNCIDAALAVVDKQSDKYDEDTLDHFHIVKQYEMYQKIHRPKSIPDIVQAKNRLVFEPLYDFAAEIEGKNRGEMTVSPYVIRNLERTNQFLSSLPYTLTEDQQATLNAIIQTAKDGKRISALIQGDVGCGKTIIAFICMMAMADSGYQSVLMAPTTILAEQHYKELSVYCDQLGFKAAYFAGNMKVAEKRKLLKGISEGEYDFVVGTQSVTNKDVQFKKLGLTVVDEEHRFGVNQRLGVLKDNGTHSITMSATPIPRSLALTMYGKSTSVYTIKTMPNGRVPVKTQIFHNDSGEFKFIQNQIKEGRQAYIVCALKEKNANYPVESVEDICQLADLYLNGTGIKYGVLTGKTPKEEAKEIVEKFTSNELQILIATTVVEVGVNNPNASVIVIRNAERYGLATLHQLRGRVGRGSYQSYCILDSQDANNQRLTAMTETTDGFIIAQKDLEQRGCGDFLGTQQSGENKVVMLMLKYPGVYKEIETYIANRYDKMLSLHF